MPTHFEGRAETIRALNAYINLVRATDSLLARMAAQLASRGLTTAQFGVLEALLHLGPMCPRTLGQKLLRSGGNITLIVDNLEKHGWVRRERQEDDRRMIMIHLTPRGRRLVARIFPGHAEAVAREMSRLTPEEQEGLRVLCRKLGHDSEDSHPKKLRKEHAHDSDSTQ
jgi:MarR family 2-MHQ and catechol resistance regulon transcriptional repressor